MTTKTTKGISFPIKIGTSILLEEGHVLTEQTIKELHLGFEYERQRCEEIVEAERERIEKEVLTPMYEEMHQWYVDKKDIIGQGALIEVFNKALQALTQPNNPE